jgi:two-component system, sensor histidine kinase YesM
MKLFRQYIGVLIVMLLLSPAAMSQETKNKKVSKKSKVVEELKASLSENDELKIAQNYEKLAEEFRKENNNAKAEEYLKKAADIYARLNSKTDKTRVSRGLAKNQESQKKYDEAIVNYEKAATVSDKVSEEKININDAERLKNASSPKNQAVLAKQKIAILESDSKAKKEEVSDAYKQQAEVSMRLNNSKDAIVNYNKAITYAKDKPEEIIKIKNEIAKVYVAENSFDEAISINEKLLIEAEKNGDFDIQIKQLQELSTIYFKQNKPDNALQMLKNAYAIANKTGKTSEVKATASKLLQYYKINKNDTESMALYADFFKNFDQLIQKDTTLIDSKTFQITEEKIKQLEKEKSLKDELITRKNKFNYVLIGSLGLLLLFLGFIAKALFSIKRKNKEIALQSLRREMNPHFIFNSLNSVNQFISQNKELEANKYLTNYSNLMRSMMENSNRDFVTLSNEVEQLKKYLDLEHLRFQDKFDFEIIVDEKLDAETTFIPNMIIQPHLENAIWHGLRYLDHKGLLQLKFRLQNKKLVVIIDDNGIGLAKSAALKTFNQKAHISRGVNNTNERIALLNDLYKKEITFTISEKKLPDSSLHGELAKQTGTIVEINFPLMDSVSG